MVAVEAGGFLDELDSAGKTVTAGGDERKIVMKWNEKDSG